MGVVRRHVQCVSNSHGALTMLDFINRIVDAMSPKTTPEFEIVTLGFDGKERALSHKYAMRTLAILDATHYASEYKPVPFAVREVK